jgi:predicted anti-sigma-YlaC factor YlaD
MSVARSILICERIRAQVSLELDGELSQLERRMLSAHLLRCPECQTYAEHVTEFTGAIRQAPLEPFERRVLVRGRRRRISVGAAPAAAAAMLAVAVLGVISQVGTSERRTGGAESVQARDLFRTAWQPERELARLDSRRGLERPGPLTAV